ncbi:hypothetical protein O9K51_04786 [Purpureocillium lavendulum]|uniref:Uncharacterized protein n=1 Tax=Purpureocillium lavendulum TaxID=1247861 RepID=A0AB34FW39_9HYPO|nr:hypothetical protein O9K51_04786 [Purpureocillium lavendulum]
MALKTLIHLALAATTASGLAIRMEELDQEPGYVGAVLQHDCSSAEGCLLDRQPATTLKPWISVEKRHPNCGNSTWVEKDCGTAMYCSQYPDHRGGRRVGTDQDYVTEKECLLDHDQTAEAKERLSYIEQFLHAVTHDYPEE